MEKNIKKCPCSDKWTKKARLLALAGDPTRIRILCVMFKHHKACVTDIADSLDMSVASISHHLQLLRDNRILKTERMGNNIYYQIVENDFTKLLNKIICDCKTN